MYHQEKYIKWAQMTTILMIVTSDAQKGSRMMSIRQAGDFKADRTTIIRYKLRVRGRKRQ